MPQTKGEAITISLNKKRKELLDGYLPEQQADKKVLSIIDNFFKYDLDLKDQLAVILDREFGGHSERNQWECPVCDELLTFRYEVKNEEVAQRWRSKLYHLYLGAMYVETKIERAYPRDKTHTFLVGYMTGSECPHCQTQIAVSKVPADTEYERYIPSPEEAIKSYVQKNVLKAIEPIVSSVVSPSDPRFTNRHMYKYYIKKIMSDLESTLQWSSYSDGITIRGETVSAFELEGYDVFAWEHIQSEIDRLVQVLSRIDKTYIDKHVPFDPEHLGFYYKHAVEKDAKRLAAGESLDDSDDEYDNDLDS